MQHPIPRILHVSLALLVAAILLVASTDAYADTALPDVVGKSEAQAVDELEALGLRVHVVTIAGASPGRVASQDPVPGASVVDGSEVELRVGVRVVISTRAPRVIGQLERHVIATLEDAYLLDVAYVAGPPAMQGRVLSQDPAPGAEIPFRGVFRVQVVRNNILVPVLVGRPEAEARELLTQAGLGVQMRYERSQFAARGTVISQEPVAGARVAHGSTLELVIAGSGGVPAGATALVPSVVGLSMYEAEAQILSAGLVPHVHFRDAGATPGWTVLTQEVEAGRRIPEGRHVGFDVAKPAGISGGARMPSLYGLTQADTADLLQHMGISANFRQRPSSATAGTVIGQDPNPGVVLRNNARVEVEIASAAPANWQPPVIAVPNVDGLRPAEAHVRLLAAGFRARLRRDTGAGEPVDRVFRQDPRAGVRKPIGTDVLYYVPYRATVPDLRGKTRTQAIDALQDASLQALAERVGPAIAGGISEVIWQQHAAGSVIARNSLVRFRFRMKPAVVPLAAVPNVIGLTREAAAQRIGASGFNAVLRAIAFGNGATKVVSQSPVAGSLRPRGHTVEARFRFVGPQPLPFVTVPRVIGQSRDAGRTRLQNLGFVVRSVRSGPAVLGASRTEIIAQSPLGGTLKARGSTVTVTWRYKPAIGVRVRVPNVTGMSVGLALSKLRGVGLSVSTTSLGTRVRSQLPAAGSMVLPGSTVKLRLKF
jgi:beta-lactam-binding protein with PASTA domain